MFLLLYDSKNCDENRSCGDKTRAHDGGTAEYIAQNDFGQQCVEDERHGAKRR
jgi:hypothetical protein